MTTAIPTPNPPLPAPTTGTIRVVIQQPCLSHYRVPVFRELASRRGLDLLVLYGDEKGITNVAPEGFRAEFVKLHDMRVAGTLVRYHAAQFSHCRRECADVVVLSWSTRYASLVPGLARARWNDLGVVLWGHGYSKAETRIRRRLRTLLPGVTDSVLFYNYTAAQDLIDTNLIRPERVFVALNTIDLSPVQAAADVWRRDPARLARFRFEHGLGAGPVVLFVSRLFAENQTDVLVRAAPALASRFPGAKVVIVGDGPDAPRLRALAKDIGADDAVRFAGAVFGEENVAPWFLSADVFCYPANVGLSLIHALSYSLPVVTGDRLQSQNPEIEAFRDNVNGLLFRHAEPDSLVETLSLLLGDAALRRRLSEGALDTVTNDYSIPKMVDGMEAAIRYAAARHPLA
ncbi:MAG: glycosyltransferase family 4 protein [Planctomycetota bacterium]|nr:glycosyltransferase family 4 protein [Planctomycetota bacterium]